MGSPPHSHSSVGRHSRESSSSRFSGSLKLGSHKISPNDASTGGLKGQKQWKECDAIEEGLLDDEERRKGLPCKCYFLAFVLGFLILFSFFSLILWGASKHQQPEITMKSVTFEQFRIQAGSDSTGVATDQEVLPVKEEPEVVGENTSAKNQLPHQVFSVSIDTNRRSGSEWFDDDGRPKRTGTVWTASAHIITAVIGSGVLSLAWAIGQLGWITGQL
ncbi:hypothetical protein D5086_024160 [Populus alba]|uniref:Uncharacterized protein n=1 Tax=Populus alba TaxID=43335 RepID=A0ACC4B678_POPAL